MQRAVGIAWGLVSLLLTSAVVGAGVGLFQGEIATRSWSRPEQIAFGEGAAFLGAIVALFVGPLLYLFLSRRMSVGELSGIVACSAIGGGLAALARWEVLVPITSVLACAGAAIAVRALRGEH
jgi:hypothetical protein